MEAAAAGVATNAYDGAMMCGDEEATGGLWPMRRHWSVYDMQGAHVEMRSGGVGSGHRAFSLRSEARTCKEMAGLRYRAAGQS